jgi:hypothetical protein
VRIGITGHQRLNNDTGWSAIRQEIQSRLDQIRMPVEGITSLAEGADQLFAELILSHGGSLVAIIPFEGYENRFGSTAARRRFDRLRALSSQVIVLPRVGSDEDCYLNAGRRMVDLSDVVLAVWDRQPAAGTGGTGDVVAYARKAGKAVDILDASRWR